MIRKTGEGYEIVFVRRLKKPIEKVWAALTIPERIADWLAVARIEPDLGVGATFALHFPDTLDYRMSGRIVALEPPRLIVWTWPDPNAPASQPGVVRFELQPDGEGCVLTLTNSHLASTGLEDVAAGWHTHLEGLAGAVEGIRTRWSTERERIHAAHYRSVLPSIG